MKTQILGSTAFFPIVPRKQSAGKRKFCCTLQNGYIEKTSYRPSREVLKVFVDSLDRQIHAGEYVRMLDICAELRALSEGKRIHAHISQTKYALDPFILGHIVVMYLKCGDLEDARRVLGTVTESNIILWTATISEHEKRGQHKEALTLFRKMQLEGMHPNSVTFLTVLNACSDLSTLVDVHGRIVESGIESHPKIITCLMDKYTRFDCLEKVQQVFDKVGFKDVFVYNVMLKAYAKDGLHREVMRLFQQMQIEGMKPDVVTFLAVLDSCLDEAALEVGKRVHRLIVESGFDTHAYVSAELVTMYSRCGSLNDAEAVFQQATSKDGVLYTAMIAAHARLGSCRGSLQLIRRMHQEGIKPSHITFVAFLHASVGRVTQEEARLIHDSIISSELETHVNVAAALLTLYGKCGRLREAQQVFDKVPKQDVVLWNSLISSHEQHGQTAQVLSLFQDMQLAGVVPSLVTYQVILSNHAGLLAAAYSHFISIGQDYGLTPTYLHYGCIIDLFARSGQVAEADELLKQMPVGADAPAWMALLHACTHQESVELGQHAGKCVP